MFLLRFVVLVQAVFIYPLAVEQWRGAMMTYKLVRGQDTIIN